MEQASVLQGIQVLDMTEALAGPLCAMMLGDLGADVLKIERPGSGDMSRGWAPPCGNGKRLFPEHQSQQAQYDPQPQTPRRAGCFASTGAHSRRVRGQPAQPGIAAQAGRRP
ncbi:MAG: CoA transferase [Anaerolineae bacterium]|nr:CoA transferase [Anaerolineae bacterium]